MSGRLRRVLVLLAVGVSSTAWTACGEDGGPAGPELPEDLLGTWYRVDVELTFSPDMSYEWLWQDRFEERVEWERGTFSVDGDLLTLLATGVSEGFGDREPPYLSSQIRWSLEDGDLHLTWTSAPIDLPVESVFVFRRVP